MNNEEKTKKNPCANGCICGSYNAVRNFIANSSDGTKYTEALLRRLSKFSVRDDLHEGIVEFVKALSQDLEDIYKDAKGPKTCCVKEVKESRIPYANSHFMKPYSHPGPDGWDNHNERVDTPERIISLLRRVRQDSRHISVVSDEEIAWAIGKVRGMSDYRIPPHLYQMLADLKYFIDLPLHKFYRRRWPFTTVKFVVKILDNLSRRTGEIVESARTYLPKS